MNKIRALVIALRAIYRGLYDSCLLILKVVTLLIALTVHASFDEALARSFTVILLWFMIDWAGEIMDGLERDYDN